MLRFGNEFLQRARHAALFALFAAAPVVQAEGFVQVGDMASARALHGAAALPDGRVLVLGGIADFGDFVGVAELYDPLTMSFVGTGVPNQGRMRPTTVSLADGRVFVYGGQGNGGYYSDAEIYDPATGQFTAAGSTATVRYVVTAVLLMDGKVLLAGGFNRDSGPLSTAEIYDPATGQFTPTGSLSRPRIQVNAAVLLHDGRVLIAGGNNEEDGQLASAELYDPVSGTFSPTGEMPEPRDGHDAVLLHDGRVLIVAGDYGVEGTGFPHYVAQALLYDPASGQFTPTGSLAHPRDFPATSILPDGRVLVAGGNHLSGNPGSVTVAEAEIYDPANGTFSEAGSMVVPRDEPVAAPLQDGSILLVGGWGFGGDTVGDIPSAAAERFAAPTPDSIFVDGFDGLPDRR